jgi:2-polyprenyl-3-methyl-5-hydroxy-6-metoxy-1,4-benzoquinol methylase
VTAPTAPALIFVVRIGNGNGSGHAVRSIGFFREARKTGRQALLTAFSGDFPFLLEFALSHGVDADSVLPVEALQVKLRRAEAPALIVLDLRAVKKDELDLLSPLGFIIAIDEGGPFRENIGYLIDMVPRLEGLCSPNRKLMPVSLDHSEVDDQALPHQYRELLERWNPEKKGVSLLVSFGGEDPSGLAELSLHLLIHEGFIPASSILAVGSSLGKMQSLPGGLVKTGPVPDLLPLLRKADLVLTSFGLTAFEAASLGRHVLLCNPGRYHEKLTKQCGFASLGAFPVVRGGAEKQKAKRFLRKLKHHFPEGRISSEAVDVLRKPVMTDVTEDQRAPGSLLLSMAPERDPSCPLCGSFWKVSETKVFHREADRSYYQCGTCDSALLFDPFPPRERYGEDYFFADYHRQYGRDYLEDFDHIRKLSRPRLERIGSLLEREDPEKKARLLDIGCAYGPFLAEAFSFGYQCEGVEPDRKAASYVREELGFSVHQGDLESFLSARELQPETSLEDRYDVITLWFVIEHLKELHTVIPRLRRLLRPGGVLAFSTPSFRGISARRNPHRFFSESPKDHLFVLEPKQASAYIESIGFRCVLIVSTGIHPCRFPFPWRILPQKLIRSAAAAFLLGDTFELYALNSENQGQNNG